MRLRRVCAIQYQLVHTVRALTGRGGCDPGWTLFEELQQCYLETGRFATQKAAWADCRSYTTQVPRIENARQQEAIVSALASRRVTPHLLPAPPPPAPCLSPPRPRRHSVDHSVESLDALEG